MQKPNRTTLTCSRILTGYLLKADTVNTYQNGTILTGSYGQFLSPFAPLGLGVATDVNHQR